MGMWRQLSIILENAEFYMDMILGLIQEVQSN